MAVFVGVKGICEEFCISPRSASAESDRKRISFLTSLSSLINQRRQLRRQALLDCAVTRVDGHSRRAAVRA